jgi:hypothetical protein
MSFLKLVKIHIKTKKTKKELDLRINKKLKDKTGKT